MKCVVGQYFLRKSNPTIVPEGPLLTMREGVWSLSIGQDRDNDENLKKLFKKEVGADLVIQTALDTHIADLFFRQVTRTARWTDRKRLRILRW